MFWWLEPRKSSCSSCLSIESLSPFNQWTSTGYSCSSSEGGVVNHFDIWCTRKGGLLLFTFGFPLLQVVIPVMTLRPHNLRLEVVALQLQFHLLRASPLRVYSRRRLCALARVQSRQNEQALPAEHLYKFYPLGNMFGIHSRICSSRIMYSQSGMSPLFSGLA
jgi:hypothetical protein